MAHGEGIVKRSLGIVVLCMLALFVSMQAGSAYSQLSLSKPYLLTTSGTCVVPANWNSPNITSYPFNITGVGGQCGTGGENTQVNITIDLGYTAQTNTTSFSNRGGVNNNPQNISLFVSDDNVTYSQIFNSWAPGTSDGWKNQTYTTTMGRYWRLAISRGSVTCANGCTIAAIDLWGDNLTGTPISFSVNNSVNGSVVNRFCVQASGGPASLQNFTPPQWIWNSTLCTVNPAWTGMTYSAGTCSLNFTGSGNVFSQNLSMESNWTNPEITQLVAFKIPGGNNNKFYPTTTCGSFAGTNKFNAEQNDATTFHLKADRGGFSSTGNYAYNSTVEANFTTNMTNNVSRACIGSDCTNWEPYARDAGLEDCFGIGFEGGVSGGNFQIQGMNVSQNTFNFTASGPASSPNICTTNGTITHFLAAGNYNFTVTNISLSTYFDVSILNVVVGGTGQSFITQAFQALLDLRAFRLFLGTLIQGFNATNGNAFNSTAAGQLSLPALVGANSVLIQVSGNYSVNTTCTVSSALSTVGCNATGIYDNRFQFNATNSINGSAIPVFTVNGSNATLGSAQVSTTNGTVFLALLRGFSYFFQFTASGYQSTNRTLPANASTNFFSFGALTSSTLLINFFDEQSSLPITANLSISFTKGATSFTQTVTGGTLVENNLDPGVWVVSITSGNASTDYGTRQYFVTITGTESQTLNAYLLLNSAATISDFTVKDGATTATIQGAIVTLQMQVAGSYVTIDEQVSDIFGVVQFELIASKQYRIIVNADGYATRQGDFYATQTSYTLVLDNLNSQDFNTYGQDFSYAIRPQNVSRAPTNFSISVSSPNGTIQWFAVEVHVNGTVFRQNVTGSPSGGTAQVLVNLTPYAHQGVVAFYFVKSVNFAAPLVVSNNFVLPGFVEGNYTLNDFMTYYGDDSHGLTVVSRGLIGTTGAVVIGALLGFIFGAAAAIIGASLVFIVAAFYGWIHWTIIIIVVGGLLGAMLLNGRGR